MTGLEPQPGLERWARQQRPSPALTTPSTPQGCSTTTPSSHIHGLPSLPPSPPPRPQPLSLILPVAQYLPGPPAHPGLGWWEGLWMDMGPQKPTFADPRGALGSVLHSHLWQWRRGKAV